MMPLLDAALAFALTMLGMATIVTMLVGLLQKARKKRRELLNEILRHFYEREAMPLLKKAATRWRQDLAADAAPDDGEIETTLRRVMEETLADVENQKLDTMAAHEMRQRLEASELGQRLHGKLHAEEQKIFEHLESRWATMRSRMSDRFRFDSSTWSTLLAILLAFVLNFDALYVLETYLNDPDAVAAALAEQSTVVASYEQASDDDDGDGSSDGDGEADGGSDDEEQSIESRNQAVEQQVRLLTSSSFPIGWELYPRCPPTSADARCTVYLQKATQSFAVERLDYSRREELAGVVAVAKANPGGLLMWIVGCLATGLLAGLGAPFWYDVVRGMTQAARSLGQGSGGAPPATSAASGQPATTTFVLPSSTATTVVTPPPEAKSGDGAEPAEK